MAYGRKWKPSRTAAREYAQTMDALQAYCDEHGIRYSGSMDSYYFSIDGHEYRVSNHSVESSNARAVNELGERVRESYHPGGRQADVIYIHAGKTRIREIYEDLSAGYQLDGRGNRKAAEA